jgi:hypothetical protein
VVVVDPDEAHLRNARTMVSEVVYVRDTEEASLHRGGERRGVPEQHSSSRPQLQSIDVKIRNTASHDSVLMPNSYLLSQRESRWRAR